MGCKFNCSNIKNTLDLNTDFDTCVCFENMNWDSKNKKCNIDCTKVRSASGVSTSLDNACKCAVNYLWVSEIN